MSKREYVIYSEAYYARPGTHEWVEEIDLLLYPAVEIPIRWYPLSGGDGKPAPRLEAFGDSWAKLSEIRDVLLDLADLRTIRPTPQQVREVLDDCGFTDATDRRSEAETPTCLTELIAAMDDPLRDTLYTLAMGLMALQREIHSPPPAPHSTQEAEA